MKRPKQNARFFSRRLNTAHWWSPSPQPIRNPNAELG
jgi:hypothetical protein